MATEKRLIEVKSAWEKAQRIYSDPVLLHVIKNVLDETPTIDAVEVVHGWTEVIEPFEVTLTTRCGLCGVAMGNLDNFCPNCGAIMDGDGNG